MNINELKHIGFDGEVSDTEVFRQMYATDASIYREKPLAVVYPKHAKDVQTLVRFCQSQQASIIPRGAGTSLAGQCVGHGIVMDISRHMDNVLDIDSEEGVVIVEPGVVRDELNRQLADTPWIFGPNTSTSNRATIGGMVGNNSSGTTSVSFGVTRDKIVSLELVLSDGTLCRVSKRGGIELLDNTENSDVYKAINNFYSTSRMDDDLLNEIKNQYPHPSIHRRNTGYALDYLFHSSSNLVVDWSKLICGSEGTLALITKITLKLDPKPPKYAAVLLSHFNSLNASLKHVPTILAQEGVYMLELMDDTILHCARKSNAQKQNLIFIQGDPKSLLMTEVRANSQEDLEHRLDAIKSQGEEISELYAERVVDARDMGRVWSLRAAGLGVLSNIPGDELALACIEDTAVKPELLADYISAFISIMKSHGQEAVFYAHAGAGELHLRPILNLKTKSGREDFRSICKSSAELVKKYNGSLSGEHGDGRVRAPFIKEFYDEKIYNKFIELKRAFDPNNIFNPGKIVHAKDLLEDLRFELNEELNSEAVYDYDPDETIFHHAERCNGSGDCRKSHALSPGMCPTYQATGEEIHTTRARANLVREALSAGGENPLSRSEVKESLSSCLACKACKSECPSGVDVALLKSEFLYQRKKAGEWSIRDYVLAHPDLTYRLNKFVPVPSKFINSGGLKWVFNLLGFAKERSFPLPARKSVVDLLSKSIRHNRSGDKSLVTKPTSIALAVDEFVNYFDISAGLATFKLLTKLGYEVDVFSYNSGRALISKGFLAKAEKLAKKNIALFNEKLIHADVIVGIEPSTILSFRDEYGRFQSTRSIQPLQVVKSNTFLFSEFLINELEKGDLDITKVPFKKDVHILQHVHCHQRALSDVHAVSKLFNAIPGWVCEQINTGCCGMAGGFGYEAEHYALSQQVANLGLYPAIENHPDHFIVASGMSCRHQIRDGVQRKARHPAELMLKMMKEDSEM